MAAASSATSWSRRWRSVGGWPSFVALLEEQGEHRVADRLGAPARDELEEQLVEALDGDPEAPPRAVRAEVALDQRHGDHARHRAHGVERAVHGLPEPRELLVPRAPGDP